MIRNPDGSAYFDPGPMNMMQPVLANRIGMNAAQGPALHIDNLSVTSVPEPGAAARTLAFAAACALRRRRSS